MVPLRLNSSSASFVEPAEHSLVQKAHDTRRAIDFDQLPIVQRGGDALIRGTWDVWRKTVEVLAVKTLGDYFPNLKSSIIRTKTLT